MDIGKIQKNLKSKLFSENLLIYNSVESTNKTAKENSHLPEGTVFIANAQTAGRGRMQREWRSEENSGIYMSILIKPQIEAENIPCLTLLAGLAVCSALTKAGIPDVGIKWPNDIVADGKKVSGILSELSGTNTVVIGIGINVSNKSFPDEISDKATSLALLSNKPFEREPIIAMVLDEFEGYYNLFLKDGFSGIKDEYEKNCITVGKACRIITPKDEYDAEATGIGENGELEILRNGQVEKIASGEVSVRGILGYI